MCGSLERGTAMTSTVPAGRTARSDLLILGGAAFVSMVLSPITAVWAVVLGVPVALLGRLLRRRTLWLVASGVLLGTVPYFALAVVHALLN
jgi:hypothetical protein